MKTESLSITFARIAAFLLFAIFPATAQHIFRANETLAVDPSITVGTFENGLTYYIKTNTKPERRAELRLVVKAGSVLEDQNQQGLGFSEIPEPLPSLIADGHRPE